MHKIKNVTFPETEIRNGTIWSGRLGAVFGLGCLGAIQFLIQKKNKSFNKKNNNFKIEIFSYFCHL